MTSYEGYSQPITASTQSNNYHTYPFHQVSSQDYPTIYAPQPQAINTAFGLFNADQGYSQHTHQDFVLDTDNVQHLFYLQSPSHFQSPIHSPTSSATNSFDLQPPVLSSTSDSEASIRSDLSSAVSSPSMSIHNSREWSHTGSIPNIVHQDAFNQETFPPSGFEFNSAMASKFSGHVAPSFVPSTSPHAYSSTPFSEHDATHPQAAFFTQDPPSPTTSNNSLQSDGHLTSGPVRSNRATSPYEWNPYKNTQTRGRRPSLTSMNSQQSMLSRDSHSSVDSSDGIKGICPIPSCGRQIKDLKAHLLTHKNERPEKCPIVSCDYHIKGFARKYDKNRHTLTHYKGTMVCDFCPGSGSSLEKSFNRADVFKRHLTSMHGVEQTAPNTRRKSPTTGGVRNGFGAHQAPGMCSTCGVMFPNAQDFYEHLDDCVLRVVQQGDPSEAINERILTSMAQDKAVKKTLERHMLPTSLDFSTPANYDQEEDDDDNDNTYGSALQRHESQLTELDVTFFGDRNNRQGMTHSKGGVTLNSNGKGNKRRKNYPASWGAAPEKMMMKKRVMCIFDGPRRLWKDDMMLDSSNEVRIMLPGRDDRRWVTDLDVQTLRRAEGLHNATEEEKGPWVDEQGNLVDLTRLMSN